MNTRARERGSTSRRRRSSLALLVAIVLVVLGPAPPAETQTTVRVCVWEIWAAPVKLTYDVTGNFVVADPAAAAATCTWEKRYEYHHGLTSFRIPLRQARGSIVVKLVRAEGTAPAALTVTDGRVVKFRTDGGRIWVEAEVLANVPRQTTPNWSSTAHYLPVGLETSGAITVSVVGPGGPAQPPQPPPPPPTAGGGQPPTNGGQPPTTGGQPPAAGGGIIAQLPFGGELAGCQCAQQAVHFGAQYQGQSGWQADGIGFMGTSDARNVAGVYLYCTYDLRRAVGGVTLRFGGGRVTIDPQGRAPTASGGGLSLLVYAGGATPAASKWGSDGGSLWAKHWTVRADWNRDLPAETYTVPLPQPNSRVTVALLLTDAWAAHPVQVAVKGLDVILSDAALQARGDEAGRAAGPGTPQSRASVPAAPAPPPGGRPELSGPPPPVDPKAQAAAARCDAEYQQTVTTLRNNPERWNYSGLASWGNNCDACESAFVACHEKKCGVGRASGIWNDCTQACKKTFAACCLNANLETARVRRDQCLARAGVGPASAPAVSAPPSGTSRRPTSTPPSARPPATSQPAGRSGPEAPCPPQPLPGLENLEINLRCFQIPGPAR